MRVVDVEALSEIGVRTLAGDAVHLIERSLHDELDAAVGHERRLENDRTGQGSLDAQVEVHRIGVLQVRIHRREDVHSARARRLGLHHFSGIVVERQVLQVIPGGLGAAQHQAVRNGLCGNGLLQRSHHLRAKEDTEAAADCRSAFAVRVVAEPDARPEVDSGIVVIWLFRIAEWSESELIIAEPVEIKQARAGLRVEAARHHRRIEVVSHPEIDHQLRGDPPVILGEEPELVAVAVEVRHPESVIHGVRDVVQQVLTAQITDYRIVDLHASASAKEITAAKLERVLPAMPTDLLLDAHAGTVLRPYLAAGRAETQVRRDAGIAAAV